MGQGRQNLPTKISALFTKKKWPEMAKTSQNWRGVICGLLQFECSSAIMGTQDCELMYAKLWITVWRICSMQKFHSKMTPRSLCTKFRLTEITYAKVCIRGQPLMYVCLSVCGWSLSRRIFNSRLTGPWHGRFLSFSRRLLRARVEHAARVQRGSSPRWWVGL